MGIGGGIRIRIGTLNSTRLVGVGQSMVWRRGSVVQRLRSEKSMDYGSKGIN